MGRTILHKILRDLWDNRLRTLLVSLSLIIGVFAVVIVSDSYAILLREMDQNYLRTNPSAATLWVSPLDEAAAAQVGKMPGVASTELRSSIRGRIRVGPDEWKTIMLFVIRDFQSMSLDRVFPDSGSWPPAEGEILIERAAVRMLPTQPGDDLDFTITGGTGGHLRYAGTAYAPGLAPAWMEGEIYGFITPESVGRLGGKTAFLELRVSFSDTRMDQETIRAQAEIIADRLRNDGVSVSRIEVPIPGEHPHAAQMRTLLFLLEAFGLLAFFLSCVLAANMISAMMAREVRQIGVMKTLGAGPNQIAGVYLTTVSVLGLLAILIALPAGYAIARAYASFGAAMLNFKIFDDTVPLMYWVLQIGLGIFVPLAVAAGPVWRGSRITITEALADYGVSPRTFGRGWFDRLLARLNLLPRLSLLAIRNTFRRRMRAFLTILTLMAAGASFITAMTVYGSMNASVASKFKAIRYDTMMVFNQPYSIARLESAFASLPGLQKMEFWGGAMAAIVREDGSVGNTFALIAPTAGTDLVTSLPVAEGRWLTPADRDAMVVNQVILAKEPGILVGDTLRISSREMSSEWEIVGLAMELMAPPTAYVNREYFNELTGTGESAALLVARAEDRSAESVAELTRLLESRAQSGRLDVASVTRTADLREAIDNHLLILATFLVMMSILVLFVGGLGLASTLGINVLERRREIGVMRALGASGTDVVYLVAGEGLTIGFISWVLAILASGPVGRWITWSFGMIFFEAPLEFSVSVPGILLWLGVVILFGLLASWIPAWDASRLPVHEVLAYE